MKWIIYSVTVLILLSAGIAQAKAPTQKQMKYACEITRGTWEELPKWCDNLHPRTFKKLNTNQRLYCMDKFNEPCECGKGMRFSVYKILGCVRSRFPRDHQPDWSDSGK